MEESINATHSQTYFLGRIGGDMDLGFAIIAGVATRTELKQFVKRLEYAGLVGVFDVEAGELPGSRLRDDIKAGNIQVSLAVKGTNRQIETYKDLAEVHTLITKTNRN
jgi:hypothetical protein